MALGLVVCGAAVCVSAEPGGWKFPCPMNEFQHYIAQRAGGPITIYGKLDEPRPAARGLVSPFRGHSHGAAPIHETRAWVLWDDEYLYVAYKVQEPFVHARFTHHNDLIYQDNDVECFIAGPDAYYEFEINAFNTCYEVFFAWDDTFEKSGLANYPEFKARGWCRSTGSGSRRIRAAGGWQLQLRHAGAQDGGGGGRHGQQRFGPGPGVDGRAGVSVAEPEVAGDRRAIAAAEGG